MVNYQALLVSGREHRTVQPAMSKVVVAVRVRPLNKRGNDSAAVAKCLLDERMGPAVAAWVEQTKFACNC